jgi:hypothetical protein
MEWIIDFLKNFITWLYDVLLYIPQKLFDLFLQALLVLIKSIPMPDFMVDNKLSDLIGSDLMFFLSMSGLGVALPIIGSAYVFYLFRRILTIGIW